MEIQNADVDAIEFQDVSSNLLTLSGQDKAIELRRAVRLYAGDFLEGLDDEWIVAERGSFRSQYLLLLRDLVDSCLESGNHFEGLVYAQKLLEFDPLDETGHRSMMLLRFLSGDRAGALVQYRRLADLLSAELGVEPSQESIDLWIRIRSLRTPALGSGVADESLAGERAALPAVMAER